MGCRIDRRNQWERRLRYEVYENYKKGYGSSFVTLTYDEEHYKGTLVKKDVQDFLKRLRYYLSRSKDIRQNKSFKVCYVGEYGSLGERGHYHAIFTGLSSGFLTDYVRKSWKNGLTRVDPCTNGRIRYTLKYMDKQIFGQDTIKLTTGEEVVAPYMVCSKGIGANYLRSKLGEVDELGLYTDNGHKVPFPKYYAKKWGIDTSIYQVAMLKQLKDNADKLGLTVNQYSVKKSISDEIKKVNSARLGNSPVDDSRIVQAQGRQKIEPIKYLSILEELKDD